MTTQNVFFIKATSGREAVMRLPVNAHGGITPKGFKMVRARFYEGATATNHSLKYALNLEAYTNADSLIKALKDYQANVI